jgi:hypothetical protein
MTKAVTKSGWTESFDKFISNLKRFGSRKHPAEFNVY